MSRFSLFKSKETPVSPDAAVLQQKALESMPERESVLEQTETTIEQPVDELNTDTPVIGVSPVAPVVAYVKETDLLKEKIENILEEDLTDLYLKMKPEQQQVFKQKGEETAVKIRRLLIQTKVNAKKIFALLRDWLKLIPGVNRFFLEQEAKIKTDKILLAKEQEKKM